MFNTYLVVKLAIKQARTKRKRANVWLRKHIWLFSFVGLYAYFFYKKL